MWPNNALSLQTDLPAQPGEELQDTSLDTQDLLAPFHLTAQSGTGMHCAKHPLQRAELRLQLHPAATAHQLPQRGFSSVGIKLYCSLRTCSISLDQDHELQQPINTTGCCKSAPQTLSHIPVLSIPRCCTALW